MCAVTVLQIIKIMKNCAIFYLFASGLLWSDLAGNLQMIVKPTIERITADHAMICLNTSFITMVSPMGSSSP